MNEIENVKGKRKPILYALSFLVLAICLLFTGIFTNTGMVAYATSYSDIRDCYFSTDFEDTERLTNFYRDTDPNTSGFIGSNADPKLTDENFSVSTGGALYSDSLNYITFRVRLDNLAFDTNTFGSSIELLKVDDGGNTSTHLLSLLVFAYSNQSAENDNGHAIGIQPVTYSDYGERISMTGYYGNIGESNRNDANKSWFDWYKNNFDNCALVSHYYYKEEPTKENWRNCWRMDNENYTYITISTNDLYSKYYLKLKYRTNRTDDFKVLSTNAVSVYDILRTMYLKDNLSEMDKSVRDLALEKLNSPNEQEITISYLEQIGDTPFATRKTKTMTAPVINNILTLENVAKVINVSTIEFMQSYCDGFSYDYTTDTYVAHYRESVCLRSKDADGHEVDYFLSPNKSYREFYYSFVDNKVFGKDCYNYYWNSMIREYPEIWNIPDYELYGYFGYTVIPNKYTLNGLWDDLFDSRSFSGSVSYFAYTDTLTQAQYDTLLSEKYDYSWLSRVWNNFASLFDSYDGVPVSNYLFYVNDDNSDKLWIGENGADDFYDDNGAIVNDGEDLVEGLGAFFGNLFENFGTYIFGGLGIVLIVVLLLWIIRAFFKTKTAIIESKQVRKRKRKR